MQNTTLCYITRGNEVLMLHRVKKQNDINKDKWIGIGGKFESNESPDECLLREAKEETGLTLTDYVNEKRVRQAIHLLQTTRLQVQAVAQRCGFQDPNYFVRLFKKKTGVTPAQYRRHTGTERTELKK